MEPPARIFPSLQPIRVLTFNISTFYRICQRKQVTAISERLSSRLHPSSRCPSASALLSSPSPRDVRWGLPCCDEAALITGSWTVCGSRYVIILQPGGQTEITQSTSAVWCGSRIHSYTSHITAVQVFTRCLICLNTGIKLGVGVEEEEG